MGRRRDQLDQTTFRCGCGYLFDAVPGRIEDSQDTPWHPWEYFATCPDCGEEAPQQAQARHLLKMWAKATGPRTPEGKAAVTKNLEGHPTPEESIRTRFNAMKHGLYAEAAAYFPAKPGRYPHCEGCPYLARCYPGTACQKRTELMLRHRIAFDTRDPSILTDIRADIHAMATALLQDMFMAVLSSGSEIKTPAWYYDREGRFHLARIARNDSGQHLEEIDDEDVDGIEWQQLYEIRKHPLLDVIGRWVKDFGLDLNSQGMTPKVQDEEEAIRGHLAHHAENETLALQYQREQKEALSKLSDVFLRARDNARRDPILIDHQRGAEAEDASG